MRSLKLILSLAISAFFLYLTFFIPQPGKWFNGALSLGEAFFGTMRFDVSELGHVLTTANWVPIGFAGILFFGSLALRAWRWQLMLGPLVRIPFSGVFAAMNIGYMANNVLPFRMGELYRAHVIWQISGLSRSAAFGNVILERVTDLLFMMPYLGLTLFLFPLPGWMQKGATITAVGVVLLTAFLVWLAVDRKRAMSIARRALSVFPAKFCDGIMTLIERFTSGFEVLRRSEHHVALVLSSLALWAMYAGMAYFVLQSLGFINAGIEAIDHNPVGAVLVVLMITTLGFVIPGAPGGVGTYHGLTVLGLSLFDVPGDRAAGFAILLHALNYLPLTILGLFYFWKLGLSFHETSKMQADIDQETHPPATTAAIKAAEAE